MFFISKDNCSGSIAKPFRVYFVDGGITQVSRDMLQNGVLHEGVNVNGRYYEAQN